VRSAADAEPSPEQVGERSNPVADVEIELKWSLRERVKK